MSTMTANVTATANATSGGGDGRSSAPNVSADALRDYFVAPLMGTDGVLPAFKSLPLFLPRGVRYDTATNAVFGGSDDDGDEKRDEGGGGEMYLVPNAGYDMLLKIDAGALLAAIPLSDSGSPSSTSFSSSPPAVSCVACLGPYRTGKSLLLSRFLGSSDSFAVGSTLEGCTRGIWIGTSALLLRHQTGAAESPPRLILLLDCEGADDPLNGTDEASARIALTCSLLSSVFLFNSTGRPDRGSLQFLSCLGTVRQRLPGERGRRSLPAFVWAFRDFFLKLPNNKGCSNGERYSLKEYMVDRVLNPSRLQSVDGGGTLRRRGGKRQQVGVHVVDCNEAGAADSLMFDFRSFDTVGICPPSKTGGVPFDPNEMCCLDEVSWDDFSEEFRSDVTKVICTCLGNAEPLCLGGNNGKNKANLEVSPPATPAQYAAWVKMVSELVNGDGVIPNVPSIQKGMLQALADTTIEKAAQSYREEMRSYINACPVFNEFDDDVMIISKDEVNDLARVLDGVAEEGELSAKGTTLLCDLTFALREELTGGRFTSVLKQAEEKLRHQCAGDGADNDSDVASNCINASFDSRLRGENAARSKEACRVLLRALYEPLSQSVRDDPTSISPEEFEQRAGAVVASLLQSGRGPALEEVIMSLHERQDSDRFFLEKVWFMYDLYKRAEREKEEAERAVQEKMAVINELERERADRTERHKSDIKRLGAESEDRLQGLRYDLARQKEDAISERKRAEQASLAAVREEMKTRLEQANERRMSELRRKEQELAALQKATKKLKDEMAAREEQQRKKEEAHVKQFLWLGLHYLGFIILIHQIGRMVVGIIFN